MNTSNARAAIELLYNGECNIFEYAEVKDSVTKITKHSEITSIEDQPCKLSFKRIGPSSQTEVAESVDTVGKLFVSPDIVVKAGSKIVVTQAGRVFEFKSSGEPAVYGSHQEIVLELFKGWA